MDRFYLTMAVVVLFLIFSVCLAFGPAVHARLSCRDAGYDYATEFDIKGFVSKNVKCVSVYRRCDVNCEESGRNR